VPTALLVAWIGSALVCLLQPSIRQMALGSNELHQGRWLFPWLAPAAALLGVGLDRLAGRRRLLPLVTLAASLVICLVVLDMARHYYARLPATLATTSLFVRPTGETDIGDDRIRALVAKEASLQSPHSLWGILAALGFTSLLLVLAAPRVSDPVRHERHPDHC
jgi:hypothetical protein